MNTKWPTWGSVLLVCILLFLASALLLLTACGTMEMAAGAEHPPVHEDEPPAPPGS